jgi:hypothetical protein
VITIVVPPADTGPSNDPDLGGYHLHEIFPSAPSQPDRPKRAPGETPPIIVLPEA